jgi:hypothetical protein
MAIGPALGGYVMLDENDIIDAVVRYLEADRWTIRQRCTTKDKGIDIIAFHSTSKEELWIEAKGETSSREGSARFGKPYTANQVYDRIAKGIYEAMRLLHRIPSDLCHVGLALPDTPLFRKHLQPVAVYLAQMNIRLFLVSPDLSVVDHF